LFGPGLGEKTAAAAEGIEKRQAAVSAAEKLAGIVRAAAKYSCGGKPLVEKPACYREFADKAIRVGAGVGVAAYAIHYPAPPSRQSTTSPSPARTRTTCSPEARIRGEAIRLRNGTATQKQVDAVVATIKPDPKVRADMIRVTEAAKEVFESSAKAMKEGRNPQWRFSNDRTAELQALIQAMERM
jgi:hypothetical protein